jgi:hypothetical protein
MIIEWKTVSGLVSPMLNKKTLTSKNRVIDMFYPIGSTFYIEKMGKKLYRVTDVDGNAGSWTYDHLVVMFPDEDVFYATLAGFEV